MDLNAAATLLGKAYNVRLGYIGKSKPEGSSHMHDGCIWSRRQDISSELHQAIIGLLNTYGKLVMITEGSMNRLYFFDLKR